MKCTITECKATANNDAKSSIREIECDYLVRKTMLSKKGKFKEVETLIEMVLLGEIEEDYEDEEIKCISIDEECMSDSIGVECYMEYFTQYCYECCFYLKKLGFGIKLVITYTKDNVDEDSPWEYWEKGEEYQEVLTILVGKSVIIG